MTSRDVLSPFGSAGSKSLRSEGKEYCLFYLMIGSMVLEDRTRKRDRVQLEYTYFIPLYLVVFSSDLFEKKIVALNLIVCLYNIFIQVHNRIHTFLKNFIK